MLFLPRPPPFLFPRRWYFLETSTHVCVANRGPWHRFLLYSLGYFKPYIKGSLSFADFAGCFLGGGQGPSFVVGWQEELQRKETEGTLWFLRVTTDINASSQTIHAFTILKTNTRFQERLRDTDRHCKTVCVFILWLNILKCQSSACHMKENRIKTSQTTCLISFQKCIKWLICWWNFYFLFMWGLTFLRGP